MAASPIRWATPERASRLLRLLILLLLVLIPVSAIYALVKGGVGPASEIVFLRNEDGPIAGPDLLPVPPPGAIDSRRQIIEQCTLTGGERKCSRTERTLKPGEPLAPPPQDAPATPQHSGFIKADFTPPSGDRVVRETQTVVRVGPLPGSFAIPVPPPAARTGGTTLAVLALLLVLGVLFNLERLLHAFETGAVFAEQTVRRLQHVGIFVAALGFLPQVDIFALLRNAALSLATPAPVGPLPVVPGSGIDIALILAGVFTVLIARIVHEANALAEDVRGTV